MVNQRIKDFINNFIIANQDDVLELAYDSNELEYDDYEELKYMISEGGVYDSSFTRLIKTVDTEPG